MKNYIICTILSLIFSNLLLSQELVIGEENLKPGIKFIFEGAIKDTVYPKNYNLSETQTDIHIEARVNWDEDNIPEGTPAGGFIPYLKINAIITNQTTGIKSYVDLIPHINLIDNFHYARNISLPGNIDDIYQVEFFINNPGKFDLSFHKDWLDKYSDMLIADEVFKYMDVSFSEIARLSRK
tara:strand:- start:9324 stop:9869 length:546 start_codon:yes stop_codon:yes gene_type:complete